MRRHRYHLKALRDIALAHTRSPHPDLAMLARELGSVVHGDSRALAQELDSLRVSPHGFRRLLLARRSQAPVSVLLMAWPPNHATPSHDHAGLWGLEMSLHGALEVESWTRPSDDDAWQLRGRDWLGPGDAVWFDADTPAMHRCRNLSRHDVALTLHVYGGDLTDCNAYEPQPHGNRWRALPLHMSIDGALRA
jgi:predicted metal-dependent enzyme (double-stranded beta helix superfamily)